MGKRIQKLMLKDLAKKTLYLGYASENIHTQIVIDCSEVFWDYPNATYSMNIQPPRGDKYPAAQLAKDGDALVWTVTDSDLIYHGSGHIQLEFKNGDEVIKSAVGTTKIDGSIETTGDVPTPLEDWMDQAEETAHQIALTAKDEVIEQIQDAAEEARESIPADYTQLSDDVTSLKSAFHSSMNAFRSVGEYNMIAGVPWEIGSLSNQDGSTIVATNRIRTIDYIDISAINVLTFTISSGYKYVIDWYNADKTANKATPFGVWQTESQSIMVPTNAAYMKLLIADTSNNNANVGYAQYLKVTGTYKLYDKINEHDENISNIENLFEEIEIKNNYVSGQTNVTSNYRYFPDNIIPYRSILEDVTVYISTSNAGSFVTLEVWELSDDGTTLTRLSTKTLSNPTANTNLTIPVNAYNKKRRMISFCKSGCYVYASNESVAGNGLYYTSDNSSTTLTVSSMTSRSTQKVSYSMKYIATDQTEYLRNYGERITNSNYSAILPDLNNAPQNVIFDIFQCLQSISNIPSSISSSLTSATFFSVKGDTQNSKDWIVQFIVPNGTETKVYVRNHMDGSWKAWKELGGVPQDANIMERDYYVATCVNKAEINIDSTKTILTFGDSITAGNTDTSWTYHFADMIGCTINNKAVAGSTFGESISEKWISTQISGVSSAEWDAADYVIVSAGTNDGVHNTPADELKTKVQAAITAIRAETDVPIIFITPIRRNTPAYSETLKLPYISGIITNVAVSNECNVICGFDFPIASETNGQITNLTRDGLHPNATGANVFARSVINALW